jgi:hypothetical protein
VSSVDCRVSCCLLGPAVTYWVASMLRMPCSQSSRPATMRRVMASKSYSITWSSTCSRRESQLSRNRPGRSTIIIVPYRNPSSSSDQARLSALHLHFHLVRLLVRAQLPLPLPVPLPLRLPLVPAPTASPTLDDTSAGDPRRRRPCLRLRAA